MHSNSVEPNKKHKKLKFVELLPPLKKYLYT